MILNNNRVLGGVGALLIFIAPLTLFAPGIESIAIILFPTGVILVMLGLRGFAECSGESGIFKNVVYALLAAIIGAAVVASIILFAIAGLFDASGLNISSLQAWMALRTFNWQSVDTAVLLAFGAETMIGLAALSASVLVATVFFRRSLYFLSAKSGIELFQTTGTLLLAGAILTIMLIGLILIWVAMLLLAVAFFSARTNPS